MDQEMIFSYEGWCKKLWDLVQTANHRDIYHSTNWQTVIFAEEQQVDHTSLKVPYFQLF